MCVVWRIIITNGPPRLPRRAIRRPYIYGDLTGDAVTQYMYSKYNKCYYTHYYIHRRAMYKILYIFYHATAAYAGQKKKKS